MRAGVFERETFMIEALQSRALVGLAVDHHDKWRVACGLQAVGNIDREPAAASNDRYAIRRGK